GADVTRAEVLLDQAEVAMATKDFGKVKGLAADAHDAVREATLIKTVRDAFASLQMDRDDLKNLGADIAGFEQTLVQLGAAIEGQDVGAARRLVAEARHTAETARDAHFRAVMENSLQIVLANAARGLDPQVARQLLREVDDDGSATRESLRSTAAEILGQARGEVARAKADGIAVEAAEQMLTDAETSYSEARYGDTIYAGKACISEVEELASASLEAKRQ